MTVSGTNFGKAAEDYSTFRAGFPDSIFDRLAEFKVGLPGHTVIDLGTGTGTLARGFALRGCEVIGVDPDPRMIYQANGCLKEARVRMNVYPSVETMRRYMQQRIGGSSLLFAYLSKQELT